MSDDDVGAAQLCTQAFSSCLAANCLAAVRLRTANKRTQCRASIKWHSNGLSKAAYCYFQQLRRESQIASRIDLNIIVTVPTTIYSRSTQATACTQDTRCSAVKSTCEASELNLCTCLCFWLTFRCHATSCLPRIAAFRNACGVNIPNRIYCALRTWHYQCYLTVTFLRFLSLLVAYCITCQSCDLRSRTLSFVTINIRQYNSIQYNPGMLRFTNVTKE